MRDALTDRRVYILAFTALPFLVGIVLQFLVGRHSDKVMERRWHVAICLSVSAIGWLSLALVHPSTGTSVVLLIVATAAVLDATGPFWSLPGSLLTGKAAAEAIALVTTLSGISNVFLPMIVGWS